MFHRTVRASALFVMAAASASMATKAYASERAGAERGAGVPASERREGVRLDDVPGSASEAPARLNPDRLRRIDYWIGVPICFALTVIARIGAAFAASSGDSPGRAADRAPKNVLFIELAEMGSTVLACPAVHRLRRMHPDCRVFFLLFKHIDVSVKVLNLIPDDQVLTIDISSPLTLVRDTIKFMREARRRQIDTAINLEMFARFSTMLSYLSGARTRVGFHPFTQKGLYIGDLFTHKVIYNPHVHTWQSLMALVQALEAPTGELPLGKFPVGPPEECVVPRHRERSRRAPASRGDARARVARRWRQAADRDQSERQQAHQHSQMAAGALCRGSWRGSWRTRGTPV